MPGRPLARPQRYQLSKRAVQVVASGHPWIFRGLISSAAHALADGQWLALYDGDNQVVGHGVYAAEGAIAIRVVARGPDRPGGAELTARLDAALAARAALREETTGFRAVHGESDGLPGVVVDVFGGAPDGGGPAVVVAQAYAAGLDGLARFAARRIAAAVGAGGVVVRTPQRRMGTISSRTVPRIIRGRVPDPVGFGEGPLTLWARPLSGQKSGTFLDLRGLRRHLAGADLHGARVLNLFAYTGGLGLACEHAGAAELVQVERSAAALAVAARHHVGDPTRHRLIEADVFDWLSGAGVAEGHFDLVIADPPSMTSRAEQVPGALAALRRLHRAAAERVAPGGRLVVADCTSRIARGRFRAEVEHALGHRFAIEHDLPPEADHPVGFPEADYLKILVLRDRSA